MRFIKRRWNLILVVLLALGLIMIAVVERMATKLGTFPLAPVDLAASPQLIADLLAPAEHLDVEFSASLATGRLAVPAAGHRVEIEFTNQTDVSVSASVGLSVAERKLQLQPSRLTLGLSRPI